MAVLSVIVIDCFVGQIEVILRSVNCLLWAIALEHACACSIVGQFSVIVAPSGANVHDDRLISLVHALLSELSCPISLQHWSFALLMICILFLSIASCSAIFFFSSVICAYCLVKLLYFLYSWRYDAQVINCDICI